MPIEVRCALRDGEWELEVLARIGDRLREAPSPPNRRELVVFGHGGPEGVGDGASRPDCVLRASPPRTAEQTPTGEVVLAVGCRTAPELLAAICPRDVPRAAGYAEELRIPRALEELDTDALEALVLFLRATLDGAATCPDTPTLRDTLYRPGAALRAAWSSRDSFFLDGFVEQLRDALMLRVAP